MTNRIIGEVQPEHFNIVLADSLYDSQEERFYDLTLGNSLVEILGNETLEHCAYEVQVGAYGPKLVDFLGWTKSKVIFLSDGPFTHDALLNWVPRHPEQ
jgi:hypothetical protein